MRMESDTEWRLDKHIPVALILAIILQGAATVWWASSINARVEMLEERQDKLATMPARLAAVEATLKDIREILLSRLARSLPKKPQQPR